MKRNVKVVISIIVVILAVTGIYFMHPINRYNSCRLKNAVSSIKEKEITLNEIVPFDWDTVYTFNPYTDKETIEKAIGIKSNLIKEVKNETMVQLIFVKGEKIVLSVCSYPDKAGYNIVFKDSIKYSEKAVFNVDNSSGTTILTRK